ncbi:MAG: isoleucine--tRNA ligase [Peptoniphilaceae bacterium]|nr:isoleucine--tRNA ligase [Peptoniphilaceae bacterium]MDY6086297.1 isoleucine--tRNA ligase [Peptoniphilaceae bacterium]
MGFQNLPDNVREGEVQKISEWKEMDLLSRAVHERDGREEFIFYEGPPTANGRPGIHHVIARTLKDMTNRYKTMQGYRVARKAGWDTHGLPVEIEVEKELGFHNKGDIEAYGVEAFNKKCRESVFKYRDLWMDMSDRMAFMADMEHPYVTMEDEYIETVWYLLNNFNERGLIYKGAKILPYCPRCGTGLASHEVAQGYQDDEVTTVYVKFPVKGEANTYFLAWTTTPWTLPSNVGLTVNPDVTYVRARQGDEIYILAEARLDVLKPEFGEVEVLERFEGRELEYKEYEQLLPFYDISGKAFFVTLADYVTTEDGTGVVHTAPAFGEDDAKTGRRYDLAYINPVDERGEFVGGPYEGKLVFDADPDVIQYLREHDKLYAKQKIVHKYPHCWRCGTPLIYYSKPSWYIDVTQFRDQMVEENKKVNWYPPYVGEKRFGNWLENLNDWALSRSRYWGTPLNMWVCDDCGEKKSIGSRAQLVKEAREDIDETIELHRPYVDNVTLTCPKCGGVMHREPDVIDVWFDSGSMPFAQWHYPFEHEDMFDEGLFPADFINEGVDQTRGWFYSLMAIAVLYTGHAPYRNVLVNDLILDANGQKMSKSKGNTLDPIALFDEYGADAVRFYSLYVSPPWLPTRFDVKGLKEVQSKFFRSIKNVYAMFALYANTNGWDPSTFDIADADRPEIDRWLLSRFESLREQYERDMDAFEYFRVVHALSDFVVEDLSNWYIRRNRARFWSSEATVENQAAFRTTYEVLLGLSKLMAPITPFLADQMYLALTQHREMDSVHLEFLPKKEPERINPALEEKMELVRRVVNLGRAAREEAGIKVRQPLQEILLDASLADVIDNLTPLIREELNIKRVHYSDEIASFMDITVKPNFKVAGKVLGGKMKAFANYLKDVDAKAFIAEVQEGGKIITLDGETIEVPEEFILTQFTAKEGFDVTADRGVYVVLDTTLNDALIAEGLVREFISKVQNQRKKNGYEVADRIAIRYAADEELAAALEDAAAQVKAETLALQMERVASLDGEAIDINGHEAVLALERQ